MLNDYESCSFIEGIDFIIIKNGKNLGNPGSEKYKKSVIRNRKIILNKWFNFLPGLHNNISNAQFGNVKSYDLECKSEFCCLLLDVSNSEICNKFDLKMKLETKYNLLTSTGNSDVYSIILFLILLQNTKNTKFNGFYNADRFMTTATVPMDKGCYDFVNAYPSYVLSHRNLPDISAVGGKLTPDRQLFPDDGSASFMPDLSDVCSIKRSTFHSNASSGYVSSGVADTADTAADDCSDDVATSSGAGTRILAYPFSQLTTGTGDDGCSWEHVFMDEWAAFQQGCELPRRFIWEQRGRNVGPEKPRLTEWRSSPVAGNGALCLALYEMRYGDIDVGNGGMVVDRMLNAYAVPMRAWISDLILLRLGVRTSTFAWHDDCNAFRLACVPPLSLQQQFAPHLRAGTIFARLQLLVDGSTAAFRPSMVRDGLLDRLRDVLAVHREVLTTLENTFDSVLEFDAVVLGLTNQMEYLGDLCSLSPGSVPEWPQQVANHQPIKQGGIALLQYLYSVSVNLVLHEYRHVTVYLLDGCLAVVLHQLYHWLYSGQLAPASTDPRHSSDFLLSCHPMDPGDSYSAWWWQRQYLLCASQHSAPWIFDELVSEILRCGKSIRLLGVIDDRHPLIRNADIIRHRPPLQLYLTGDDSGVSSARRYVTAVESVAAESLRSQTELAEHKKTQLQAKATEAQIIRERLLQARADEIAEKNANIRNRRRLELDRLRNAAVEERARRRALVVEEKRLDMELLAESPHERRLVDELKYELTKQYASKIEDAASREQAALDRIRHSESRILAHGVRQQEDREKDKQVIGRAEEVIEGEHGDIGAWELAQPVELLAQPVEILVQPVDILAQPVEILAQPVEILAQPVNNTRADEAGHHDRVVNVEPKPISAGQSVVDRVPTDDPGTRQYVDSRDQRHMDHFHRINVHGHTGDSTLGPSLCAVDGDDHHLDKQHLDTFHRINANRLAGESTAERALYPDCHGPDDTDNDVHMANFSRINVHGHTGDESGPANMAGDHGRMDHFRSINVHGHVSQSTVQELMYPGHSSRASEQMNNSSITDTGAVDTVDMGPSVRPSASFDIREPSDWLAAIKHETANRSRLLQGLVPLQSHGGDRQIAAHVSSLYPISTNSIYGHLDRSILAIPGDKQPGPGCVNIDREPIDVVISKSIVAPIMAQVKLVDKAIMDCLLTTFRFRGHLHEIRKYMFLEDGRFSAPLLASVFELTSLGKWASGGISRVVLADLVKTAVNCVHTASGCLCANVCLCAGPATQVRYHNQLDEFCIGYTVPWPLDIVIGPRQLAQYQAVFRAIAQIKYGQWCLAQTRHVIKSWHSKIDRSCPQSCLGLRRLYSCLTEMEHWVRSIDSSLGSQGPGCGAHNWHQMMADLDSGKTSNLDALIESHAVCLDGVVVRCVLAGDDTVLLVLPDSVKRLRQSIRQMIIDVLGLCYTYYRLVSINYWHTGNGPLASPAERDNNAKIVNRVAELHHKFKQYGQCLLRVIKACSQDSYLDHLFVSLDYNDYYHRTETF